MSLLEGIKKISIADIFTLSNGIFGLMAVWSFIVFNPDITLGTGMIFLGMICDGADGFMARKFGSKHEYGRYLDSISDSITFGLAPGVLIYIRYSSYPGFHIFATITALTIVAFSWIRLYVFTVQGYKFTAFHGLATPGMTFFVLVISHILVPKDAINVILALSLSFMSAIMMVMFRVRYPKIRGKPAIATALGIVIALIFLQYLRITNVFGTNFTVWIYRIITFLGLGIIAVYIFISPVYEMYLLRGEGHE